MNHSTVRGRIRYTSTKPERLNQVRGGETFVITIHEDGRRTLRAHCAIDENPPRVLRDVVLNVGPRWYPTSAYVQISVDEAFAGGAWYRMDGPTLECEGLTAASGRISDRRTLEHPPFFFGTHPIQADAWITPQYDLSRGPGRQVLPPFPMCSLHHRGADGPGIFVHEELALWFVGREEVTVAAGRFDALHFRIGDNADDLDMRTDQHPPYHTWVAADGTFVVLKAHCTGYMQTMYELVEYERGAGFV